MTNKEAIEELKKVDTLDMPARLCEAHYMAIKALEQEPCDDAISRQAVLDVLDENSFTDSCIKVRQLPSVNPQEPKTGHWIWKDFDEDTGITKSYWCSECNKPLTGLAMNYCGCCGAKMVEPQESEE